MQQTTTWLCPVCERVLNVDELIIDGYATTGLLRSFFLCEFIFRICRYFDQILKETPESVEDVMVEADGEWHTTDNQYASAQWRSTHPPVPEPNPSPPSSTPKRIPTTQSPSQSLAREQVKVKASGDDVVVLDSDDEDEGRVKRELSPSFARDSSGQRSFSTIPLVRTQTQGEDVIDLTLDSDDDEPPRQRVVPTLSPPTQVVEKRKAVEPEPTVVGSQPKKVRTDDSNDSLMRAMAMRTLNMASPSSSSQGARDHGSSHSQRPLSSSQRSASASQSRYTGPSSSQASRYPSSRPPYYTAPYANGFTPVPVPRGSSGGGSASPSGSYRSNGASSARWS
jgi:E3 SUMO-protein ligase PIAS1